MEKHYSLKTMEKQAFRTTFQDGLWDVMIGSVVLELALAPLFSETMGDFSSSMVFLPFWALVYVFILQIRKQVVAPRLGRVKFGSRRRRRTRVFRFVMAGINLLLVVVGLLVFFSMEGSLGQEQTGFTNIYPWILGILIGIGFTIAAWLLDYPRLFFYGTLFMIAPPVGELLVSHAGASHHGFPLVFGFIAAVMILWGGVTFLRMIKKYSPLNNEDASIG